MPRTTFRNLHVPLSQPLYRRLRAEADRVGRPATELAREAIDRWLAEQQRRLLDEAVRQYALKVAGTNDDLDPDLEAAGIEHLLSLDEPGKEAE